MRENVRSFLAILLPVELKKRIYQSLAPFRRLALDMKWVEEENYHLTLKFFGDLTSGQIRMVKEVLPGLAAREAPFHLQCGGGVRLFPDRRRPRVLCLALEGDVDALHSFRAKAEHELVKAGLPGDSKKFHPHITLGRLRSLRNSQALLHLIQRNAVFPVQGWFAVQELFLMASQLTPQGPRYTPLAAFPLQQEEKG